MPLLLASSTLQQSRGIPTIPPTPTPTTLFQEVTHSTNATQQTFTLRDADKHIFLINTPPVFSATNNWTLNLNVDNIKKPTTSSTVQVIIQANGGTGAYAAWPRGRSLEIILIDGAVSRKITVSPEAPQNNKTFDIYFDSSSVLFVTEHSRNLLAA